MKPLQVQIPVSSDKLPATWDDPSKCLTYEYHWYRTDSDTISSSHGVGSDHWLPARVFDQLTGGRLSPTLGIRVYASEGEAMADVRRVRK